MKLIYTLFKKAFFIIAFLYFIALVLALFIIGLKDAYKLNLQNEFATKQPHIKILFIESNPTINIQKDIKMIKNKSSLIDEVVPFVSDERFLTIIGNQQTNGSPFYNGSVKIIGLGDEGVVYNFFDATFVNREPFLVPYTPLEFLYAFHNKNIMVFNKSLFNSFFPIIESTEKFQIKTEKRENNAYLSAIFNDFEKQPIIYTTIKLANKLLGNNINRISGYYVNAKSLEDIDTLLKTLKSSMPKDKYIVSSWLEDKHKQFMMFSIFETLASIIVFTILLLSILFIVLLLYDAIIKKSYQLSVLFNIGFNLKKELFFYLFIIMIFSSVLALYTVVNLLPYISTLIHLKFSKLILNYSLYYTIILDVIFILISYILIHYSYKLKVKSVF